MKRSQSLNRAPGPDPPTPKFSRAQKIICTLLKQSPTKYHIIPLFSTCYASKIPIETFTSIEVKIMEIPSFDKDFIVQYLDHGVALNRAEILRLSTAGHF